MYPVPPCVLVLDGEREVSEVAGVNWVVGPTINATVGEYHVVDRRCAEWVLR